MKHCTFQLFIVRQFSCGHIYNADPANVGSAHKLFKENIHLLLLTQHKGVSLIKHNYR